MSGHLAKDSSGHLYYHTEASKEGRLVLAGLPSGVYLYWNGKAECDGTLITNSSNKMLVTEEWSGFYKGAEEKNGCAMTYSLSYNGSVWEAEIRIGVSLWGRTYLLEAYQPEGNLLGDYTITDKATTSISPCCDNPLTNTLADIFVGKVT